MTEILPILRSFLPNDLILKTWSDVAPYAIELESRELKGVTDLEKFVFDHDELCRIICDEEAGRYVRSTANTDDKEAEASYNDYTDNIEPKFSSHKDKAYQKIIGSPYLSEIQDPSFSVVTKKMLSSVEIFREQNLDLISKDGSLRTKSSKVRGAMSVKWEDKEITLQQASKYLTDADRIVREQAWRKIKGSYAANNESFDTIFDEMVKLRHQIALNAGLPNYRDYMFKSLKRFDYTPEDCFAFHQSISEYVVPIQRKLVLEKQDELGLSSLRPWDLDAEITKKSSGSVFDSEAEMIDKTLEVMKRTDPDFYQTMSWMQKNNSLDLWSRKHKRPGGYQLSFMEKKIPYIHANFTGQKHDVVTIVHEAGHAVHDFLVRDLPLMAHKEYPMELAELASMSMELITMDHWDVFYEDESDLLDAKKSHLKTLITRLPSIAAIDSFQHKIYTNPDLNSEQRNEEWVKNQKRFSNQVVDWSGLEEINRRSWQATTHVYNFPFYYIEYGFAQLGALQVWRNYKQDPEKAIAQYKQALSLGYTKPIPEVYKEAGIKFDFSAETIQDLMQFFEQEYIELTKLSQPDALKLSPKGPTLI